MPVNIHFMNAYRFLPHAVPRLHSKLHVDLHSMMHLDIHSARNMFLLTEIQEVAY